MKIALKINWILTILLSISTGVFKLMQQEADIDLFKAIGFNETMIIIFGLIQFVGGILLIPRKTRKPGAFIMIMTFIIASIAVFANKMMTFGMVSLIFILMAYLVVVMENKFSSINTGNE